MFDFLRLPFRGREKFDAKRAKQDAITRANYAQLLLNSPAFFDSYQCELDILVDEMISIDGSTLENEQKIMDLHRRICELNNLISHLKSFANQKKVMELEDEAA
mgnify:CR=1 FL=1